MSSESDSTRPPSPPGGRSPPAPAGSTSSTPSCSWRRPIAARSRSASRRVRLEARSLGVEVETATPAHRPGLGLGPAGPTVRADLRAEPRQRQPRGIAAPLGIRAVRAQPATCTDGRGRAAHRSSSTGSPTPATTRSFSARPGPARRCSPAPRWPAASCAGSGSSGVDPLGDYRRLTETLGGTYVELGAGGGHQPARHRRRRDRGGLRR